MTFQLNPQQTEALEGLSNFESSFVLKGYAGTGKSTVIAHWVEAMCKRPEDYPPNKLWHKPRIVLTAPTNKATNVLAEKAAEIKLPVDTSTIHSLLKLRMTWKDDKQILVPDSRGEDNFGAYNYVVIDECSMLNEELMQYILDAQDAAGNKIIYMGDPCQLPPINEPESASFTMTSDPLELTQVMRQADGSKILDLALYLRELILSGGRAYPAKIFEFVDNKSILHRPAAQHEEEILSAFTSDKDVRLLAWTNKVVDAWNDKIRDKIYGVDREPWTKGEQIVTTKPVMHSRTGDVLFPTDTLLQIDAEPREVVKAGVACHELKCKGKLLYVPTLQGQSDFRKQKDEKLRAAKADRKRWREFYDFMETFSSIKPAHAMTCHRSQGSTFEDVYVCYQNILQNPRRKESLQCLYVAITRPKARVVLV